MLLKNWGATTLVAPAEQWGGALPSSHCPLTQCDEAATQVRCDLEPVPSAGCTSWQRVCDNAYVALARPWCQPSVPQMPHFSTVLVQFQKRDFALTVIGNRLARLFPVSG